MDPTPADAEGAWITVDDMATAQKPAGAADKVYAAIRAEVDPAGLAASAAIGLAERAMQAAGQDTDLTGAQKKEAALSAITRLVQEVPDGFARQTLDLAVEHVLPAAIDALANAVRSLDRRLSPNSTACRFRRLRW